jgi:hypothetical protein
MNKFQKICVRIGLGIFFKKKHPKHGKLSKQLRRHLLLRELKTQKQIDNLLKRN